MRYHFRYEDMTDAERAERFRYFTLEPGYWDLPGYGSCTDPDTLRAAAEIEVAAIMQLEAAEAEAAGQDA